MKKNRLPRVHGFCELLAESFETPPKMKRPKQINDGSRFSGQLRHYHRSGGRARRTWEQWVDGEDAKPRIWMKCLKIAGVILALLALGAVVAGLVISLR
jgi:hypothetical protein